MKKLNLIWMMLYSAIAGAVDLGALDETFSQDGTSDGWDLSGEMDFNRYGSDVLVDSQGRIYIVGTFNYFFNGDQIGGRVERRLPNGQLDPTFDGDGTVILDVNPAAQSVFEYELQLDSTDGIFVGFSTTTCVAGINCHADVYIYHINANGAEVGTQKVGFNLGVNADRQDDVFADMVYIPSQHKLAVAAEVEWTMIDDTDYGIVMIDSHPVSGALSIDNGFSDDGKAHCFFDHANPAGAQDHPEAIVWDSIQNHLIVGGSTFEGNGIGGDGWNMSFCEFDMQGALVRKWSTESSPDSLDDREFLSDMQFVNMAGQSAIIAAGALPGPGDLDVAITRYTLNQISGWDRDLMFGSNGSGYETTGFQFNLQGDTSDSAKEMLIEEDGSILVLSGISWANNKGAVALSKYTEDGILNSNWGIGKSGKAVHAFDLAVLWDVPESLAINTNTEEIYVAGFSYDGLDFKSLIANMHNDSIFGGNFDF